MFKKNHLYYALPAVLVSTLAVIAIVFAWQEPGDVPPLDNVPAPINVGSYFQSKSGPLTVWGQFSTATSTFLATHGGRVGIGITNPGSTLTVRRSAAGTAFGIRNIGNTVDTFTVSDTGFAHMTGLRLGASATAGHVLTADVNGVGTWQPSVGGIAWPLRSPIPGTAAEPAYSWSADTNTGIRLGGADNLRLVTNSADRLIINSSGDVGIGAINPSQKLDVDGTIRLRDHFYDIYNSSGVNGQVLTRATDGPAWQDAPTGNGNGNGIGGSGTTNYIPRWTGNTTLGDSVIYQSGNKVGIGTTNPGNAKLKVVGGGNPVSELYGIYAEASIRGGEFRNTEYPATGAYLAQWGGVGVWGIGEYSGGVFQSADETCLVSFCTGGGGDHFGVYQSEGDRNYFSGRVGIKTDDGVIDEALHVVGNIKYTGSLIGSSPAKISGGVLVEDGDVYLKEADSGLILKSPNGSCWKITVDNNGDFTSEKIACL